MKKLSFFSFSPSLTAVVLAYMLTYGWLLWHADFLPYVMDNNESFSSLGHAYNLFYGDYSKSFGLTDEAYSFSPEAHPMIHTHQGNWPRIFAFVLFALGARSIESQIVLTTFSIGLLSIIFMYYYFKRMTNILFATLVSIIFMTDYILFAQWQVCTYRVWHVFFVFSSFLCTHALGSSPQKRWITLNVLNYFCLFYWELVFAVYLTTWVSLYTLLLYFRTPKRVLITGISIFCGLSMAITLLFSQLTAFMGWHNVVQDFAITLTARNAASSPEALKQILMNFYDNLNIAVFYNIVDGSLLKTIYQYLTSFFSYGFQVHTPILTFYILASTGAWLISTTFFSGTAFSYLSKISVNSKYAIAFLSIPLYFLFIIMLHDGYLFASTEHSSFDTYINYLVMPLPALSFSYLTVKCAALSNSSFPQYFSAMRLMITAGFLMLIFFFIDNHHLLYIQQQSRIWHNALTLSFSKNFLKISSLIIVFLCCQAILRPNTHLFFKTSKNKLCTLFPFLFCGLMAYTLVYILSPGYVYTGYLQRFAPFHVFVIDTLVAIAIYFLIAQSIEFLQIIGIKFSTLNVSFNRKCLQAHFLIKPILSDRLAKVSAAMFPIMTIGIISYWFFLQFSYTALFPPDIFQVAKILKEAQFQGKSSVSNTYTMPFSIQTSQWSYLDQTFAEGKAKAHIKEYLWFADRKTNKNYNTPELFICFIPHTFDNVQLKSEKNNNRTDLCSNVGIVRQALFPERYMIKHTMLQLDPSGRDHWAIIQLDWTKNE